MRYYTARLKVDMKSEVNKNIFSTDLKMNVEFSCP